MHLEADLKTFVERGVHLVGLGIKELIDTPCKSIELLKNCDVVAYLGQSPEAACFLRNSSKSFVDLRPFYRDGDELAEIYDRISASVISLFDQNSVAFATNGNPLFLNRISAKIMAASTPSRSTAINVTSAAR